MIGEAVDISESEEEPSVGTEAEWMKIAVCMDNIAIIAVYG
jgi:hypothetical protein